MSKSASPVIIRNAENRFSIYGTDYAGKNYRLVDDALVDTETRWYSPVVIALSCA